MKYACTRLVIVMCVLSCATLAAVEIGSVVRRVQATDQNGDGRADLWRHFDAAGHLTVIEVDSNFDGKPDIEEYYERGVLVRRESDRNFNGQADLVEEFDAATHGLTRSVVDIDYDGTADLLVLFRDGRPVFSKRASAKRAEPVPRRAGRRSDAGRLVSLVDPFQQDTAFHAGHAGECDEACVGLSTSGGLPSAPASALAGLSPSASIGAADVLPPALALRFPRSPRAPPRSVSSELH